MIKAICDFADGKKGEDKDRRQADAAHNAAQSGESRVRQWALGLQPTRFVDWSNIEDVKSRSHDGHQDFVTDQEIELVLACAVTVPNVAIVVTGVAPRLGFQ